MRRPAALVRPALAFVLTSVLALAPAAAADGAAELFLDRHAVAALVASSFPAGTKVAIPPFGEVTVTFVPPEQVQFIDGALEARIGLRVLEAGIGGSALFRFVPEVRAKDGLVRLRTIRARPDGALSALPNLASLVPPIDMQGVYDWIVPDRDGGHTAFGVRIVGVDVKDDRLQVRFGISAREAVQKADARPR